MREIRPSGLEGGETQLNASSLPLSGKAVLAPAIQTNPAVCHLETNR
jgi:hypothetical protein